jgi:hypothetical protein
MDRPAAALLRRAYAAPGTWTATWLAPPGPGWRRWAAREGIDLEETDRWGEVRWVRGFKRAVYYLHEWHWHEGRGLVLAERRAEKARAAAIIWDPSKAGRKPARLGYPIRIRAVPGGGQAARAVTRKPARIYAGNPAQQSGPLDHPYYR